MNENPPITNVDQAEKQKAAQAIHVMSSMKAGEAPTTTDKINKLGAAFTSGQARTDLEANKAEAIDDVATIEREKNLEDIDQSHQNIKDQEQLNKAIEDQKNQLIAMDIGITEDDFANEMMIRQLEEEGNFQNESQILDFARIKFKDREDYVNLVQESDQRAQQQVSDDATELVVFNAKTASKAAKEKIQKDEAMAEKIRIAEQQAKEKEAAAKAKANKTQKMVGAAKMVGGAVMMYYTGGAVGGEMVASGASDVTAEA